MMLRALRHFGKQYSTIPVELRENEPGTAVRILHIDPTALSSANEYFELRLRPDGLSNAEWGPFILYADDLDLAETVLKMTYDGQAILALEQPGWERLLALAEQANNFQMNKCATEFLVNATRDYLRANEMDEKRFLNDLVPLLGTSMREYAERVARSIVFGIDYTSLGCLSCAQKCTHYSILDVPEKLLPSVAAHGLIFFGCENALFALIIATTNEKRANACFEKISDLRALHSHFRCPDFADGARAALASIPTAPSGTARARLRVRIEMLVNESQKHKPSEECDRQTRARLRKLADLERLEELVMRDPDPSDPDRDREELEALEDGNSDLAAKKRRRDAKD